MNRFRLVMQFGLMAAAIHITAVTALADVEYGLASQYVDDEGIQDHPVGAAASGRVTDRDPTDFFPASPQMDGFGSIENHRDPVVFPGFIGNQLSKKSFPALFQIRSVSFFQFGDASYEVVAVD